ncbi:MAG TPA: porin [Burkholderiales bacterium]|nr:porin [Burkholderiales bacterium]
MQKKSLAALTALALGAMAGTAQAQAPAQGIEVKLSGQVNRALLSADDGVDQEWFNVDNGNSSTRFRFNAEAPITPALRAGILFEVEYKSNPSSDVNFATRSISPELDERHMDVFFAGPWGRARLGQGDGAANGASEVDLSGTSVAHYASTGDIGGGFEYRTAAGALSGASISGTISNQDFESRYDRLLYQTPVFSGFMGEASWGHKDTDVTDLALRYSGKIREFGTLAAALGWSSEDAAPGGIDDETVGGSVSWLHPSGISLTYAHTSRDLAGRTGKFDYFKAGYEVGKHAVSVDYAIGQDQAASGDEAKMYGIGYVFTPIAWAEVFALYKLHSMDRPGADLDDISFFMVGTRVKF